MDNVTIYSIAEATGVSPSTVSRVLNNNPHVRKATRAKVLKALDDSGYVPNDTARNLVTQSSHMIGILVSDIREVQQSNTVYTIERSFMAEGYSCLIYNTGTDLEDLKSYIRLLIQKKVDGVILMGSTYQREEIRSTIRKFFSRIPVIAVNARIDADSVYSVFCDIKAGISSCIDLLISKGRKHIGFIYAGEYLQLKSILDITVLSESRNTDFFMHETARRPEEICASIADMLKTHPDADGLIFTDDYLAIGGIRGIIDCGKRIPEDISVIGISNSRYSRMTNPRLTSLDIMLYDCALTSVRAMLQAINGEYVPKNMIMSPKLVEREST